MDIHIPTDSRSSVTLSQMITPYTYALSRATSIKQVTKAIIDNLPPGIAHNTELRIKMIRGRDIFVKSDQAATIAVNLILSQVCKGLSTIHDNQGNREIYYMREDLIRWYNSDLLNAQYFDAPNEEIITIAIQYDNSIKTANMKLTEDQIIGIAYGLNGIVANATINNNKVTIHSSITNDRIEIDNITNHAIIYSLPITLATEEFKRPYRIDVIQPNKSFITLHFITPEFIQGILSVVQWYQIPNGGNGILWKNLFQFTREGLIPLCF